MRATYSTYEAKARFSEILRKVRAGQRIVITYRGEPVAEIRPTERAGGVAESLAALEEAGIVAPIGSRTALAAVGKKRGALARFLESRE
jgi:prevent-host-death family protein